MPVRLERDPSLLPPYRSQLASSNDKCHWKRESRVASQDATARAVSDQTCRDAWPMQVRRLARPDSPFKTSRIMRTREVPDMEQVVIAGPARTAFGKLGGALSSVPAVDLGACSIRTSLERAGVPFDAVDQVIMGTVITAGMGQIPARQAAVKAGLSKEVPALTVNKVCASSLKAVNLAAQMIRAGDATVVVAG